MKKQPFKGRGQIYKWLRKWHRTLVDTFEETEAGWAVVVEDMVRDGVVGSRGSPPNPKSAAKVWSRVCRDVAEADRARRIGVVTKAAASRAPKGWKPPLAEKHSFPQSTASPFAPTRSTPESSASDDMSPDELMAGIRGVIEKRSGR